MTDSIIRKELSMSLSKTDVYTTDYIYSLPEGKRAELIDGVVYNMAPPNRFHQKIISRLTQQIANYIDAKGGNCEVYPAPFAVFLNEDDRNYLEPDISIICDQSKLNDRGCSGAPDWIIEVTSPTDPQRDYGVKLFKYRTAGVREYWIINPQKKSVTVFDFENDKHSNQYTLDEDIPVCIFPELVLNIQQLTL